MGEHPLADEDPLFIMGLLHDDLDNLARDNAHPDDLFNAASEWCEPFNRIDVYNVLEYIEREIWPIMAEEGIP